MLKRTNGFSLIEVMLTLFLTLFLITTLTHLYLQHHRNFLQQQRYLAISASAIKVISLLQDEINLAGQVGCARLSRQFTVKPYQNYTLTADNSLMVSKHALSIRYQSYPTATLVRERENKRTLILEPGVSFDRDQLLVISDCTHAEIFRVKSIHFVGNTQHLTPAEALAYDYQAGAEVGHLVIRQYVATDNLSRLGISGHNEVIQDNIHQLQFQREGKNIYFAFQTLFNHTTENWYGYAAKE